MPQHKVLIIDDNIKICNLIKKFGEKTYNYEVAIVQTIDEAIDKLKVGHFDLITLDIELENDDGLQRISDLKSYFLGPIIFVSCINEISTIVEGLKSGADDYITKPFDLDELFLRINRSLIRSSTTSTFMIENYTIDEVKNKVELDGDALNLSPMATRILIHLLKNKNKILSREDMFEDLWDTNYTYSSRVIDTHLSNIRKETNDIRIRSIRSVGYVFDVLNKYGKK